MSKNLHIYTGGVDPFVFTVGEVTVHIHAGTTAGESPETPRSSPGEDKPEGKKPTKTVVTPPLAIIVESPGSFDDLLSEHGEDEHGAMHLGLEATGEPRERDLATLLEGLSASEAPHVEIDLTVSSSERFSED